MNRRKLLKWTTPVIVAVVLPAHAQTSDVPISPPEATPRCELPFVKPLPGQGTRGQCKGRGLKATSLNERAYRFNEQGKIDKACEEIKEYKYCGFHEMEEDCNEWFSSIINRGEMSRLINCE